MATRTRITIETDSLLVRRGRTPQRAWCQQCGTDAEMIPLHEIGVVSNLPLAEVRAWLESSNLHHAITAEGAALVCLNSMLKRVQPKKTA